MEYAKVSGHLNARSCETLVLLVGFSLEPLLQSICVYKPSKIVLVLNEKGYVEEWSCFVDHIIKAVDLLVKKGLIQKTPRFLGIDGKQGFSAASTPEAVFQILVKALNKETDVVIDVTGGKKSMVSGAYMYAAYAGTRISYVDFDEYDPEKRRPYGYSCKIDGLANPYQEFALREWEQVRALYNRYQFREARMLLEGKDKASKSSAIINIMQKYVPNSVCNIQCMIRIIHCYELWDAGLYNESKLEAQSIQVDSPDFNPPTGVTCLGGKWFNTKQARFAGNILDFYEDKLELQAYVCDELARIKRLISFNLDYRSAFLRAGSLNEIVMLARLVKLIKDDSEKKGNYSAW